MNTNDAPKYYNFEILGIDKLVEILALWNRKITNIKSSSIPLEKRKELIINTIRKVMSQKPNHKHFLVINTYFAPKEKTQPKVDESISNYKVGDIVLHNINKYRSKYILAKVTKINEKSITIQLDTYREIEDENAMRNQTFGETRLIWHQMFNGDKVVVRQPKYLISKESCLEESGINRYYLRLFEEGAQSCDYGY